MDHDWLFLGAVRGRVFQVEAVRQVEVQLHGRHLPGAADGVPGLHGNFRAVECCPARVGHEVEARFVGYSLQDGG